MSNGVLTKFTPLIHLTICCVCISLWVGPDHPKQTDAGKQQQRQLLSPKKAKLAEPLKKERGPGSSPSLTTTFITSALLPTRSQIHPSHLLISSPPGGVPSFFPVQMWRLAEVAWDISVFQWQRRPPLGCTRWTGELPSCRKCFLHGSKWTNSPWRSY